MRTLKLQMQVSINGYVAGPNGEMDWMTWNWGDDIKQYVKDITEPVDCIVMGRKLAEGFIPHWKASIDNPETKQDFGEKMVYTHKVVFSKTMETSVWEYTDVATGDLETEISKLKNQPGGDIITYGGSSFASALVSKNLIDEYHLFVNPAAIANGLTIFNTLESKLGLSLVKVTPFDCGIVALCYTPEGR